MSKSIRLFVILAILVTGFLFIFPTIKWYYVIPDEDKKNAELPIQDIVSNEALAPQSDYLQDLKEYKKRVASLGLDIIGGIHVLLEADFVKYASNVDKPLESLTEDEKKMLIPLYFPHSFCCLRLASGNKGSCLCRSIL